jgi:TRAP-type uncharacterized transport system fused permease subunit
MVGLVLLSAAFSAYFLTGMRTWERWVFAIAALLFIAPGWESGLAGLLLATPAAATQFMRWRAPAK